AAPNIRSSIPWYGQPMFDVGATLGALRNPPQHAARGFTSAEVLSAGTGPDPRTIDQKIADDQVVLDAFQKAGRTKETASIQADMQKRLQQKGQQASGQPPPKTVTTVDTGTPAAAPTASTGTKVAIAAFVIAALGVAAKLLIR